MAINGQSFGSRRQARRFLGAHALGGFSSLIAGAWFLVQDHPAGPYQNEFVGVAAGVGVTIAYLVALLTHPSEGGWFFRL